MHGLGTSNALTAGRPLPTRRRRSLVYGSALGSDSIGAETVNMTSTGARPLSLVRISGFLDIKFDIVDTVFGTAVSELLSPS